VALGAGLSRAEVEALRAVDSGSAGGLEVFTDARERALLAWTDLVALGPAPVPPAAMEAFRAHFDEAEVVELTMLVGATVMLNRYATALELPISVAHDELLRQHGFDA
jgi:alkylhydroperoxidase family enzyme